MSRPLTVALIGDSTHRVTVPLPPSLKVLNDAARRLFGYAGQLQLYLRGTFPIIRDQQLAQIQDGDVIVITWDDQPLSPKQVSQIISTHQADFVEPARREKPRRDTIEPRPPAEPYQAHRVTEQTSYNSSYVTQPLQPIRSPCSPRDMFPASPNDVIKATTGTSSYADEYVWREGPPRPRGQRPSDDGYTNPPFESETTYNVMYTPPGTSSLPGRSGHPSDQSSGRPGHPSDQSSALGPNSTDRTTGGAKFEGTSTYRDQYKPMPLAPRPKGQHPDLFDDDYVPNRFGKETSEHRANYRGDQIPIFMVHLEPEVGKWAECH